MTGKNGTNPGFASQPGIFKVNGTSHHYTGDRKTVFAFSCETGYKDVMNPRNAIITAACVISVLFLAVYIFFGFQVIFQVATGHHVSALDPTNLWWLFNIKISAVPGDWIWVLAASGLMVTSSVIGTFLLRSYYKQTSSPEIYFFLLFMAAVGSEAFRAGIIFISVSNGSQMFSSLLSRALYFSRLVETLYLFTASMFAVGIQYQRESRLVGIILLGSFTIAYFLPIDSTVLPASFLLPVSNSTGFSGVLLLLDLLILINYTVSFIQAQTQYSRQIILILSGVVIGRELVFFMAHPVTIILGLPLFMFCSLWYSRTNHELFLWS